MLSWVRLNEWSRAKSRTTREQLCSFGNLNSCIILASEMKINPFSVRLFPSSVLQVVVHFTADWCMPSVVMKPFFENLAVTYQDMLFLVVDVDEVKVIHHIYFN